MVTEQDAASFGDLLRRYRLAADLTQEELAERAGLSKRGISDLERGARTRPQRETIHLLGDALGLCDSKIGHVRRAPLANHPRSPCSRHGRQRSLSRCPLCRCRSTPLIGREHEVAAICARCCAATMSAS